MITPTDLVPEIMGNDQRKAERRQNAQNTAIARLAFNVDQSEAELNSVQVELTGTADEADRTNVRLWYDTDGDGEFDPAADTLMAEKIFSAERLADLVLSTNTPVSYRVLASSARWTRQT